MRRLLAGTIGALVALGPAAGVAGGAVATASSASAADWRAVGRVDFGTSAFCTGTLIAEDLVLTAAHCLYDRATGRRYPTSEIEFRAGLHDGRAVAARHVRRAVTHPDFTYSADDQIGRVAHDLALLRLDRPIHDARVTPLGIEPGPHTGDAVGVVSYAGVTSEAPSLKTPCEVMARQGGVLVLGCAAAPGASGSPVFVMDGGVPRVVSVISAMATVRDRDVSLGTALTRPLARLRQAMGRGTKPEPTRIARDDLPLATVASSAEATAGSRAKFLKVGN